MYNSLMTNEKPLVFRILTTFSAFKLALHLSPNDVNYLQLDDRLYMFFDVANIFMFVDTFTTFIYFIRKEASE